MTGLIRCICAPRETVTCIDLAFKNWWKQAHLNSWRAPLNGTNTLKIIRMVEFRVFLVVCRKPDIFISEFQESNKIMHCSKKQKRWLGNKRRMGVVVTLKYSMFVIYDFVQHAGTWWNDLRASKYHTYLILDGISLKDAMMCTDSTLIGFLLGLAKVTAFAE